MKISTTVELKKMLLEDLNECKKIAIVTHHNPDGDGLPACLALQEILKQNKINSDFILEELAPENYQFISAQERTLVVDKSMQYECLILVDCHEKERIGDCSFLVDSASKIITIDHHPAGKIIPGSDFYIDVDIVSAGGILYSTFNNEIKQFPENTQQYLAECFYTTILNDTDHFVNANVDSFTYKMCSELMNYNLNPGEVTTQFLYRKKAAEMRFVGEVLSTIETKENGKVLFMNSTLDMLKNNQLDQSATSKLTRWVKGTDDVKVIVYFREIGDDQYRLSLRSNFINVNKIAVQFNGGGHQKASGCELNGSLEEVKEIILSHIKDQLT